jgi:hypothetical protein
MHKRFPRNLREAVKVHLKCPVGIRDNNSRLSKVVLSHGKSEI